MNREGRRAAVPFDQIWDAGTASLPRKVFMDEKPKSIWKKTLKGWQALLLSSALAFAVIAAIGWLVGADAGLTLGAAGMLIVVSWAVAGGVCLFCWLFCRRNLKHSMFGLACFATLIALAYAEEDWRGWHAWNQFKHEWEAKGEKFDWQSVVPPPVPDDQNFAMAPIWVESIKAMLGPERARQWNYPDDGQTNFTDRMPTTWHYDSISEPTSGDWANGTITDLKLWQTYFRKPTEIKLSSRKTVATNEFPIAPQPQTPAQDVLLALSKNDAAIEKLRQASKLPFSRFALNYDDENPAEIMLPHLSMLKRSSQVLQLRAIAELDSSQNEKAFADVQLALCLANSVRTEPCLISHLVRNAMLQITLQPVYEGLAERRWSDAQLATLDSELAKLDFLADCQNVQKSEIAFSAQEANYLRRHRDYAAVFLQMDIRYPMDARFKFAIYRYMPSGWFYQSALKNGRTLMEYSPAVNNDAKTISPTLIRRADAAFLSAASVLSPLDTLYKMFGEDFQYMGKFIEKIAAGQTYVNLTRTAIALERYRLAHGEFPETLDALAPQFIAKLPHDVIGGGPLKYRRTSDGQFVLYSVGWNETDDGGVVVLQKTSQPRDEGPRPGVDLNQGDWVWRYPKPE